MRLEGQIERLEGLVAALLDVARLEAEPAPRRARVDLAALVRGVLAEAELLPERTPRHRLVLDGAGPVWLVADPDQLERVATNLVTNALKYSPEGGAVRCAVRQDAGWAYLTVSDEGVGIAPEEQARLFRPFARARGAERGIAGSGLGLYITRQLVARHGGTVALSSAPGRGTTVRVSLPQTPPGAQD